MSDCGRLFASDNDQWAEAVASALGSPAPSWAFDDQLDISMTPEDLVRAPAHWRGDGNWRCGQWVAGRSWVAVVHDIHGYCAAFSSTPLGSGTSFISSATVMRASLEEMAQLAYAGVGVGCPSRLLALVAQHPDLSPATKESWARSHDWVPRASVAADPALPQAMVEHLALSDTQWEVTLRALENPSLDPDVLRRRWQQLRGRKADSPLDTVVVNNSACPPDVLMDMLNCDDPQLYRAVIQHPNLPEEYRQLIRVVQ